MAADFKAVVEKKFAPSKAHSLAAVLTLCGFDAAGYIDRYADLKSAGITLEGAPYHFLARGLVEGRVSLSTLREGLPGLAAANRLPIRDEQTRRALLFNLLRCHIENQRTTTQSWDDTSSKMVDEIRSLDATPYLLFGDSHSTSYTVLKDVSPTVHIPLHFLCTGGSAMGLDNQGSRSGYNRKILNFLKSFQWPKIRPPIFFKFGQIDAEFTWIFHRIRNNQTEASIQDFEVFSELSVSRYARFLDKVCLVLGEKERLRVCSIFPPALSDDAWGDGYMNAHIGFLETGQAMEDLGEAVRKLKIHDLAMRTKMHELYNLKLKRVCCDMGITFLDDFSPLMGNDAQIKPEFMLGHSGKNHHLRPHLIASVLNQLIPQYM